jgi:hypothetical protein
MDKASTRRPQESRVPLTITLDPATYDFVESCAGSREFRSVDDLFEAALSIYKHHLEALKAYIELQETRGMSLDDIKRTTQYEIVFTHNKD